MSVSKENVSKICNLSTILQRTRIAGTGFDRTPSSSVEHVHLDPILKRFRRTVDDPEPYERTSQGFQIVQEELHSYLWTINKSPMVLLLGEKNVTSFPSQRIAVRIPGLKRKPKLWLMLYTSDRGVERMIFLQIF